MLLTVKDAASRLGLSPALIYALCSKGRIRHERHGLGRGVIRISEDALEEYRRSREVGVAETTPPPDRSRVKLKHLRVR
jgi:excisionase family DNA binding protein